MTQIATVRTFSDLHAAMRKRASELAISQDALKEISGVDWIDIYFAKRPRRKPSLITALIIAQTLGMVFVLVEDEAAMARIKSGIGTKKRRDSPSGTREAYERRLRKKWSRQANAARQAKLSPEERSYIARTAARAQWARRKEENEVFADNRDLACGIKRPSRARGLHVQR